LFHSLLRFPRAQGTRELEGDWNMNELPNDVLDIIYKMKFQKEYKLVMDDIRTKFVYKDVLDELTRTSLVMAPFIECETGEYIGDYYYLTRRGCYYPLFDEGTKDRMIDDYESEIEDAVDVVSKEYRGKTYYVIPNWDYEFSLFL